MTTQKNSAGTNKSQTSWLAVALSAIAASLCCITPIFAFLAGAGGIASTFSWMEPLRPFLVILTLLILAFAWYQKLKPKKVEMDCACEVPEKKTSFLQSKPFLGIVSLFAILMLMFPYYSHIFYPKSEGKIEAVNSIGFKKVKLNVEGMTCQGCEEHIKQAAYQVDGVIEVKASHDDGNTEVTFDSSKTSLEKVIEAVNSTGYTVTTKRELKN